MQYKIMQDGVCHELGTCPKCGCHHLQYFESVLSGNSISYEVKCLDCGFWGLECYNVVFDEYMEAK